LSFIYKIFNVHLISVKQRLDLLSFKGLDFIGEIHPTSSAQHKWILSTIDYFSKWVEAIPTSFSTDVVVIKFLEENILSRFGCPRKIIIDNAQCIQVSSYDRFLSKIQYHSWSFNCLFSSG
jgi:hypothetical protein